MNRRPITLLCLMLLCLPLYTFSQIGCEYTLRMYDSFGDGWNGGYLTVSINDKSEEYEFDDGPVQQITLFVLEEDKLSIIFTPGSFAFENSFSVFNAEGVEVFYSGQDPPSGEVYRTTIECPSCPNLIPAGVAVTDIRHDRARISWVPNDTEGDYLIRFGSSGTPYADLPGIAVSQINQYLFNGLEENTSYSFYLQGVCSNGDSSNVIGPFTFKTLLRRDVGIVDVVSPVSDCDLPADSPIEVVLKNYGGAPQTLIPFNYSVNGIPGGVNQPNDGFFTGILSHDSTYSIRFDATYDFSAPQPYEVKVWTELEGDGDVANDTFTTIIVHTPLIYQFPYRMDFEGGPDGWMLDAQESSNPSLELGVPKGNVIRNAVSGNQAWVTNLNGSYNNNERSVLLSPCFDLSSLDKDPELSFYLWVSTESTFDGFWVETSVDGGSWTKLGKSDGDGAFWYNTVDDIYDDWWTGNNVFGGWRQVRHPLTGLAGQQDVRIRFIFRSDEAVTREGIGIDDIQVAPILENNMSALQLFSLQDLDCGSDSSELIFSFRNEGTAPQSDVQLAYQIDDGPVVKEDYSEEIAPGTTVSYTFTTTFDSSMPRAYVIKAWTEASGEEYFPNDTVTWIYSTAGPGLPFLENFEDETTPEDWILADDLVIDQGHNSGSSVLFDNLWKDDPLFEAVTPLLGAIAADDTLFFAYRFVDFTGFGTAPTVLGDGDALYIEVSEDCGVSFNEVYVVNAANHQTKNTFTRVGVPLQDYEGQWIKIRFRATWGNGDFYFDLDNVNIRRCPADLGLTAAVTHPVAGNENGSIRIEGTEGILPYTYIWNNGNRTASRGNLASGTYAITVSDQQGCSESITVVLESVVPATEPESPINTLTLFPNPNDGQSLLNIELKQPEDISIFIFDARGARLEQIAYQQVSRISRQMDLSRYPDGVYSLRILAGGAVRTVRLIKANTP